MSPSKTYTLFCEKLTHHATKRQIAKITEAKKATADIVIKSFAIRFC